MTRQELLAAGFIIDDGQRPFAYKGPRFNPTESVAKVPTEREEALERVARMALGAIENENDCLAYDLLREVLGEKK